MFAILKNGRMFDIEKLEFGDVRAVDLSREEVERRLLALRVPGIKPGQGRAAMLEIWARHLAEVVVKDAVA